MSLLPFQGKCWNCGHDYSKDNELYTLPPSTVPLEKYNKLLDAANGVIAYVDSQKAMCEHLSVTALRKAIAEAEGKEG